MRHGEAEEVLTLALSVFDQAVAPDFTAQGVEEFTRAARSFVLEAPEGHVVTVAAEDDRIIGMIDVRDASHVCLFFVETARQRAGIGRALLAEALRAARGRGRSEPVFTANSAPSAVRAYERLGFAAAASEEEIHGIRFVAMTRRPPSPECRPPSPERCRGAGPRAST